jgi:signal transduction histidine kinase
MMKMKHLNTLRVRFALWTGGLFLLILTVFSSYVYINTVRGLYAAVDDSLTLNAMQVINALNIDNGQLILPNNFIETPDTSDMRTRGFTIQIFTAQQKMLAGYGTYHFLPFPTSTNINKPTFTTYVDRASNDPVRVYTTQVTDNNKLVAYVQVAQSLQSTLDTIHQLLTSLLVSVPLLVLVAGVSGYFLAARALAPINEITQTARHISAEDLSKRLNLPATNDEVGRLAQTFDDMLARLDESFQHERQFTSDASHELRTPLTAMQAILSVMRDKPRSTKEYETALDDLADETDRLQSLTESLLHLSLGESHRSDIYEIVNLSTLICDVSDSLRPLAESKNLQFTYTLEDNLIIRGNRDDLIRLFVNLIDNAIKYTTTGVINLTAVKNQNGNQIITISDTGGGISSEHLPHIFDRFYRIDRSRSSRGTGLGLAIVKDIVGAHQGTIEVTSEIGKGTIFIVQLPGGNQSYIPYQA